jgi:cytochrome c oxidase subunit III
VSTVNAPPPLSAPLPLPSGSPPPAHAGPAQWPAEPFVGRASALKLGMWLFLISDAFSFSGLLLTYGVLRAGSVPWWPVGEPAFGIGFTAGLTFLLICSSLTMALAVSAARAGRKPAAATLLALTMLGGILFLVGQAHEYTGLLGSDGGLWGTGLRLGGSHRATTFYVVTSFHGAHVLTGVVILGITLLRVLRVPAQAGGVAARADAVESVGLFWHFVDLVWILVFTFVYLVPAAPGVP